MTTNGNGLLIDKKVNKGDEDDDESNDENDSVNTANDQGEWNFK